MSPGLSDGIFLDGFLGRELRTEQRQLVVGHHQPAAHGLVVAGLAINRDLDIRVLVVALLCRHGQCRLDRLKDDVLGHTLLVRYRFRYQQDFFCHRSHAAQPHHAAPRALVRCSELFTQLSAAPAPSLCRQTATGTRAHRRRRPCPPSSTPRSTPLNAPTPLEGPAQAHLHGLRRCRPHTAPG
jgi:hypothetical protein